MTVERIQIPAIRYVDERGTTCHLIPLRDPDDGTWWILDEAGVGVARDAASVREFADEWDSDPEKQPDEDEPIAAKRALADLLDELERGAA